MWICLLLTAIVLVLVIDFAKRRKVDGFGNCRSCTVPRGGKNLEAGVPLYEGQWFGGGFYEGPYGRYPDDQPIERRARWPWQALA
jgi:hypothetical protein